MHAQKIFFARFATFANNHVTTQTHAQRFQNDYGHSTVFPKKSENAKCVLAKTSWCDSSLKVYFCVHGLTCSNSVDKNSNEDLRRYKSKFIYGPLKPNTHRRRRRDETVESRRVGGVYANSQLVGDSFVVSLV